MESFAEDVNAKSQPAGTSSRGLPQPGDLFGHYKVLSLLGQGGMGAVYEAQDTENGRRVALKVLGQALNSPEARERFFREGRSAASINHPNSVYVFGTEEIAGTPVISMELVPGGTLQDRVRTHGTLPSTEAVSAVLQVIEGLQAAQRVGILHRDVKPSNCFISTGGNVKIGDFGLSISSMVRTEPALTATGAFLGTPTFSSPEQLRGDELNARSDMYSVGATLYFLLTGRPPFDGKNVVQLLATILERRPVSPRQLRQSVPKGLASVVMRCLEKRPEDRYRSYEELARALAPYGPCAATPATLGLRMGAGLLDLALMSTLGAALSWSLIGGPMEMVRMMGNPSFSLLAWMTTVIGFTVLYYALLESRFGATLGKMLCGLRVTCECGNPPVFPAALVRASIYVIAPIVPYWTFFLALRDLSSSNLNTWNIAAGTMHYVILGLLFLSARRRNGYASVYDLLTGTRVVSRLTLAARPTPGIQEPPPSMGTDTPQIGPYHILEPLGNAPDAEWLLAYDVRLLRKVWVRRGAADAPPVGYELRNVARPGRQRWLTGRREKGKSWDAFEALTGRLLTDLASTPQPWNQVRFWLHDLAVELRSARSDGTLPATLSPGRVWITAEGRAKLLDFAPPGTAEMTQSETTSNACASFLAQVSGLALQGNQGIGKDQRTILPLPLHAQAFLRSLPQIEDLQAIITALVQLLPKPVVVTRLRRAVVVFGCAALAGVAGLSASFGAEAMSGMSRSNPGLMELNQLLHLRTGLSKARQHSNLPSEDEIRLYIGAHFASVITNRETWLSPFTKSLIGGESRQFAENSISAVAAASPEQIKKAEESVGRFAESLDITGMMRRPWVPFLVAASVLAFYVALPALIAALLFRGGLLLRASGIVFVAKDGSPASRLRVFWRSIVAWSSLAMAFGLFLAWEPSTGPVVAAVLGWAALGLMAAGSLALPDRGIPDRLAKTWPVMR
jgi:hypothetical protein